MFKKVIGIGAVLLIGTLVLGAVAVWALPRNVETAYSRRQGVDRGPVAADPARTDSVGTDAVAEDLTESEVEALILALDDEYKAWSVYDQVIDDFGAVQPFISIQRAEENHIAALISLFERYGLDVPTNEWPGNVPAFDTLEAACKAGVEAEIDNAALYDQLFSMVDNPDIIRVFGSLQQASETKHLPAFERCVP